MYRKIQGEVVNRFVWPYVFAPKLEEQKDRLGPTKSERPLFLLLRYKYCHGDAKFGISNEEHAVSYPLRSANVADIVEIFFDEDHCNGLWNYYSMIEIIKNRRPELIVLSSYDPQNKKHPHLELLSRIRSECEIPILWLWHDSVSERSVQTCADVLPKTDLHVALDSYRLENVFSPDRRVLSMWVPLDSSVFYPGKIRDIPLSFLGSTGSYRSGRNEYLDYLSDNNIQVYHSGGQTEQFLSRDEYAEILRRSKISLNFSHSVEGHDQLKARVFEILYSGALLIENENDETKRYFTPMVDYIVFDSLKDMADKVRYYSEREDECAKIAESGHRKAVEFYNYKTFWEQVLSRLSELKK